LRLYHGLLRNKLNKILLEIASGVRQHTRKLKQSNKQNGFPELHHPEDHQLVEFVKKKNFSNNSTLWLYHGLLRNKHNEILLEISSRIRQHTPKLKKSNKQNTFPELHHPEDHQLVEFVKIFFVSINSTLWLNHGLLRNKHNERWHNKKMIQSLLPC
jgi:ribosomal protein S30